MISTHSVKRWLANLVKSAICAATGSRVVHGPFKGLQYVTASVGSVFQAKLFGTYEMELHPVLGGLAALKLDRVVDVGAAEGYYAIGLARLLRRPVVAYEMDPVGRDLLARMAELNGVSSLLSIRGECVAGDLEAVLSEKAGDRNLVVCDVEGAELLLMDPVATPALRKSWLLVEAHDLYVAGITQTLRGRFKDTHRIVEISTRPRVIGDFPKSAGLANWLPAFVKLRYMDERRPEPMIWLWMTPVA